MQIRQFGNTVFGTIFSDEIIGTDNSCVYHGRGGDDKIFGLGGEDKLFGGRGNDFLDGGDGNDFVSGGLGDDQLFGGLGDDTILGGRGNDYLEGGLGSDILKGGLGDDTLRDGLNDDSLFGGKGNDTYIIDVNYFAESDDFSIFLDTTTANNVLVSDRQGSSDSIEFVTENEAFTTDIVIGDELDDSDFTYNEGTFFYVGTNDYNGNGKIDSLNFIFKQYFGSSYEPEKTGSFTIATVQTVNIENFFNDTLPFDEVSTNQELLANLGGGFIESITFTSLEGSETFNMIDFLNTVDI
ncbi:MAG: hypothetical protein SFT81_05845 [Candidatus Caenarcaniphilales bacterium]|nr:hypothetical protein [Candidatus Caenarcaniphilales bacterium]